METNDVRLLIAVLYLAGFVLAGWKAIFIYSKMPAQSRLFYQASCVTFGLVAGVSLQNWLYDYDVGPLNWVAIPGGIWLIAAFLIPERPYWVWMVPLARLLRLPGYKQFPKGHDKTV